MGEAIKCCICGKVAKGKVPRTWRVVIAEAGLCTYWCSRCKPIPAARRSRKSEVKP